jgi:hypothetical protein
MPSSLDSSPALAGPATQTRSSPPMSAVADSAPASSGAAPPSSETQKAPRRRKATRGVVAGAERCSAAGRDQLRDAVGVGREGAEEVERGDSALGDVDGAVGASGRAEIGDGQDGGVTGDGDAESLQAVEPGPRGRVVPAAFGAGGDVERDPGLGGVVAGRLEAAAEVGDSPFDDGAATAAVPLVLVATPGRSPAALDLRPMPRSSRADDLAAV